MNTIELSEEQGELKKKLINGFEKVIKMLETPSSSDASAERSLITELGDVAHKLHLSLKADGNEPRHHRYMIDNRGLATDDPKFYEHIHAIEDLIKFTNDTSANDDPVDHTLNVVFKFRVFSKRWGHDDIYQLKRTKTGWHVGFMSIGGSCDKGGKPYLFDNLDHDSISYPSDFHWWLEWIWDQALSCGLSKEKVQGSLDQLSTWLKSIEELAPNGGIWSGFRG